MSQLKKRRHAVDILFTLALFCVLAASSVLVVVLGVHVYQGIVERMNENYDLRTSLTYISAKVRQNDGEGMVYLSDFGDAKALVMEQNIGENVYQTMIYQSGGQLRELFVKKGGNFVPEDGQSIMEIETLHFEELDGQLIRISVLDERNNRASLLIHPRSAVVS